MSDSDESGVTYTDVSSPFEELSEIGSPRADDHEHLELPEMLEDPYVEVALQAPPSQDDEDDDMDIEADEEEEEEHPAPADSIVATSTAADQAPYAEETEPFKTNESAAIPPPHPAYRMQLGFLFQLQYLCQLAPPPSPICSLGYRAAMIRLRAEAASTSHSLPLPPPFILSLTRSDAPSSGTPLLLLISASTSPPPLQLPSASIALGPGYEIGESSSTATARPAGGLRANYSFVATMDREIMCDPVRESERQLLAGRLNMLFRDRRVHAYTHHMMETEARLSREAWVRSTDASDLVCEMLRADHRRSTEIIGLRTALQGQVIALQGQ
nr:hypothetical protein [Tanacetum cinerariifolium]